MGQDRRFGLAGAPAGGYDQGIALLGRLRGGAGVRAVLVDDPLGAENGQEAPASRGREPAVQGRDGMPAPPRLLERGNKAGATGKVEGDDFGHGFSLAETALGWPASRAPGGYRRAIRSPRLGPARLQARFATASGHAGECQGRSRDGALNALPASGAIVRVRSAAVVDQSRAKSVRYPWVAGARPRTLPASLVPVLVGTGAAAAHGDAIWWRALLAGVVSLALQVGVNYANDYSDGVRGTDAARVGPVRLVASGLATPDAVKRAALLAFSVAGAAGLSLAAVAGWWLVAVGLASVAAAWLYTGGPKPYGYTGLGELSVFVFFGLVATVGTAYVQTGKVTTLEVLAALPVGLVAVALLVVNNLRDIAGDAASGKRTLAVRLGAARTRWLYCGCVAGAALLVVPVAAMRPWALLGLGSLAVSWVPARKVLAGAEGRSLVEVLGATGQAQLVLGLLLAAGLAL